MGTWEGIIGASFTPATFNQYCYLLNWLAWWPSFVVLHNTSIPSLADRPHGLTNDHMRSLESCCRAGPHLFIDDRQIWVFTPLTASGGHSPNWNKLALGVKMLGEYATKPFNLGRRAQVQANTVAIRAPLHAVLGPDPATLRLHKEDPKTSQATPANSFRKLPHQAGAEFDGVMPPRRVFAVATACCAIV